MFSSMHGLIEEETTLSNTESFDLVSQPDSTPDLQEIDCVPVAISHDNKSSNDPTESTSSEHVQITNANSTLSKENKGKIFISAPSETETTTKSVIMRLSPS